MPSLDHEAPIAVLRDDPALLPVLLREALHRIEYYDLIYASLDEAMRRLSALVLDIGAAGDRATVERLLATLPDAA